MKIVQEQKNLVGAFTWSSQGKKLCLRFYVLTFLKFLLLISLVFLLLILFSVFVIVFDFDVVRGFGFGFCIRKYYIIFLFMESLKRVHNGHIIRYRAQPVRYRAQPAQATWTVAATLPNPLHM